MSNSTKRAFIALLIATLALCLLPASLAVVDDGGDDDAPDVSGELELQLGGYDLAGWQDFIDSLAPAARNVWGGKRLDGRILDFASGAVDTSYANSLERLKGLFIEAFKENARYLSSILGIAFLSGLISVLLGGDEKGAGKLALFVCYGMCVGAASYMLASLSKTAYGAIDELSGLMELVSPVLGAMLAATGSVGTAGLLQPMTSFLSTAVAGVFKNAVMPLVLCGGAVAIAGNLCGREQLNRLCALIRSVCKWIIGAVFTAYLGMISLQGASVAGAESISLKTVKYTLDKSLPVIGGAVAGTFDSVRGCAILIKNAAGAAAIMTVLAYVLSPAVNLGAAGLTLKLASALCEPVSDARLPKLLGELSELCNFMFAAVVAVALMFIITAGLVMSVGGNV